MRLRNPTEGKRAFPRMLTSADHLRQMKPLLHLVQMVQTVITLGSNVITDGPLLHLGPVITLVPSTSSTDKKSGSLK